jgi:hypothetical protein
MADNLHSLYGKLSGLEPVTTDTSSSVLESIALINKLSNTTFKTEDADLKQVFNSEVRFLRAGLRAINESPQIRLMYGEDFSAALKVAELMKKRAMEKQGSQILDSYLDGIENSGSNAERALRAVNTKAIETSSSSSS